MNIREAIAKLVAGKDLGQGEMTEVMMDIMTGETTDAQNGGFLVGLQAKGVTAEEILGAANVMRELSTKVAVDPHPNLVDTCGTGGSGSNTFNVSTAAALVAACAGAVVAKHGNRGATSKSGSADVLEAAGVNLALDAGQVAQIIASVGVGFMFAPAHHSAMRHVITARKEIGVRSIFNLLGPLTNPAGAVNQVMGVFDAAWIPVLLEVHRDLGNEHVLLVHSDDGLDEISISADTQVGELCDGEVSVYKVAPEDFGISRYPDYSSLQVNSAAESLALIHQAFAGQHQCAADIIALNAGAAIYAANVAGSLADGVSRAREVLASGSAQAKLDELVASTQAFSN